jgi:hypothetical protein
VAPRSSRKKSSSKRPKKQAKKRPKRRAKAKSSRRPKARAIAVGDVIRLPAEERNQIIRYDPQVGGSKRGVGGIEGIVCVIRQIATGKPMRQTRGPLAGFVLEILHSRTFDSQFSAPRNTGGAKAPGAVSESPTWARTRDALREMKTKGQLVGDVSALLRSDPFSSLLDGWRVVKVRADLVDIQE